jgi:hypothetical protein
MFSADLNGIIVFHRTARFVDKIIVGRLNSFWEGESVVLSVYEYC